MTSPNRQFRNLVRRNPVRVPEDDTIFRLAQLVLLFDTPMVKKTGGLSLERLSYYDFLAANPLLMITDETDADRNRLIMCGFDGRALSYASPTQRFTSRRERLQHDLARLVAYELVNITATGTIKYVLTAAGHDVASQFSAMYSRAYKVSAEIVVKRLVKLSDRRLRELAREWIAISPHSARPEVEDLLFSITTYSVVEENAALDEMHDGSDPYGHQ